MNFQPFKDPCHCGRRNFRKTFADILPLHPKCHVFSSVNRLQYRQVMGIKKVKLSIRAAFFFLRVTDIIQFLSAAAVVIKGRDELKVAIICGFQDYEQLIQTVNALLQRSLPDIGCSIPVLDFPFHTECIDIITAAFNLQHTAELVIHFDVRDRAVASGKNIKDLMKTFRVDAVGCCIYTVCSVSQTPIGIKYNKRR